MVRVEFADSASHRLIAITFVFREDVLISASGQENDFGEGQLKPVD